MYKLIYIFYAPRANSLSQGPRAKGGRPFGSKALAAFPSGARAHHSKKVVLGHTPPLGGGGRVKGLRKAALSLFKAEGDRCEPLLPIERLRPWRAPWQLSPFPKFWTVDTF